MNNAVATAGAGVRAAQNDAAPKVFVVLLNWNRRDEILDCLRSLAKTRYENYRVIIVDNASSDDSVAAIRALHPDVTLIESPENKGYAGGNNLGMRHALREDADYVWLLNNDTVVEPDTLIDLVAAAQTGADVGMASPVLLYEKQPEKPQFLGQYFDWEAQELVACDARCEAAMAGREAALWGTALLISRALIETIGYLDEKLFAYWEDVDYSAREG